MRAEYKYYSELAAALHDTAPHKYSNFAGHWSQPISYSQTADGAIMRDANDYYRGIYESAQADAEREAEYRNDYVERYKKRMKKELGIDYIGEPVREASEKDLIKAFAAMDEGALAFGSEILAVIDAYWTRCGENEYDERH